MNISEVLAAEIPQGPYRLAMEKIYQDAEHFSAASFYTKAEHKDLVDSLCAAFESLMDLSNGALEHENLTGFVIGKKAGHAEAIKEVLAVVDELHKREDGNSQFDGGVRSACITLQGRIRALEVPSEQA